MSYNNNIPFETRQKGYIWCRECVGGIWSTLTEDDLQITPLSGGLTNYLYVCSLPNNKQPIGSEPRQVLLRIYGDLAFQCRENILWNSVIFAIMAERKMGPKMLGCFPEGRLEEFLPARPLQTAELAKPEFSRPIARKLAKFHCLRLPLCKQPTVMFNKMQSWLDESIYNMSNDYRLLMNEKLQKYMSFDLVYEFRDLKKMLVNINSPVVFSHNDLQEGNILLRENSDDPEERLTLIDLEFSSYNYRGFDLANHFMEWCYDYTYEKPPYFTYTPCNYPSWEEKCLFLREYLSGCGDVKEISESDLRKMNTEVDVFALSSSFFWGLWALVMACSSEIDFDYIEYAISRFDHYFTWKTRIVDKIIT